MTRVILPIWSIKAFLSRQSSIIESRSQGIVQITTLTDSQPISKTDRRYIYKPLTGPRIDTRAHTRRSANSPVFMLSLLARASRRVARSLRAITVWWITAFYWSEEIRLRRSFNQLCTIYICTHRVARQGGGRRTARKNDEKEEQQENEKGKERKMQREQREKKR